MRKYLWIICLLFGVSAHAQKAVLKTNLLSDLTATANLGVEFGLSPKWTMDVSASLNAWTFSDNKKWKRLMLQPEVRYWMCQRFNGSFWGAHLLGGIYNIGNVDADFKFLGTDFGQLKDYRYEGWMVGAGISYGYHWMLSRRWSLEAEIGIGYIYTQADKFECPECGEKIESKKPHHYFGPTKAAVNLVYVF